MIMVPVDEEMWRQIADVAFGEPDEPLTWEAKIAAQQFMLLNCDFIDGKWNMHHRNRLNG